MAYNKAKEERKWKIWKEAEEKQLRKHGVSEETIEKFRVYDWAVFNSERRFQEKRQDAGTYLETVAESMEQTEVKTVEDFLDSIENEKLHHLLLTVDKLTLRAVMLKIQGFSVGEISTLIELKEDAIYKQRNRLKEILKKLFKGYPKSPIPIGYWVRGQNLSPSFPLCGETGLFLENLIAIHQTHPYCYCYVYKAILTTAP